MYHDVVSGAVGGGGGPQRFSVTVESFERALDAIAKNGFTGCSLSTALRTPRTPRVAITFDDGTSGQFLHALPVLVRRGMTATFFVTTDWIGTPGFMNWDQLRELKRVGMSVQSHTKSHPFLSELGADALRDELTVSKRILDRELEQDTQELAFPGGNAPRRRFRSLLNETGYRVMAGSRWGTNAERVREGDGTWVRRCTALRDPSPALMSRIVRGDPRVSTRRAVREATLYGLRGLLGPSRYARIRRRVLDFVTGHPPAENVPGPRIEE